jgi:hypothetical protein
VVNRYRQELEKPVEAIAQERKEITLIIVYGVNKPLPNVEGAETIAQVKLDAMGLFGIPASEQNQYVLKAKVDGKEVQLDEAKTVESYELHNAQKVTLAAGTPFGRA